MPKNLKRSSKRQPKALLLASEYLDIAPALLKGAVGVLLTDTIYGLVGQALQKKTVERIYELKGRDHKKPLIVLISGEKDLLEFGIKLSKKEKDALSVLWDARPTSIIFPVPLKKFSYIHRGTDSIAFRKPAGEKFEALRKLLRATGPLVAPSANPEGEAPATDLSEALGYFGDQVDFYVDGGRKKGKPSRLLALTEEGIKVLRK